MDSHDRHVLMDVREGGGEGKSGKTFGRAPGKSGGNVIGLSIKEVGKPYQRKKRDIRRFHTFTRGHG